MKYEPSSDLRQAAIEMRRMFESLVEVGFTDEQAMSLVLVFSAPRGGS